MICSKKIKVSAPSTWTLLFLKVKMGNKCYSRSPIKWLLKSPSLFTNGNNCTCTQEKKHWN